MSNTGGKPAEAAAALEEQADRTERIIALIVAAIRRRRPIINNDRRLRGVTVVVKLYPSSGKLRELNIDLSSSENLEGQS